jgi:hypothetical protein
LTAPPQRHSAALAASVTTLQPQLAAQQTTLADCNSQSFEARLPQAVYGTSKRVWLQLVESRLQDVWHYMTDYSFVVTRAGLLSKECQAASSGHWQHTRVHTHILHDHASPLTNSGARTIHGDMQQHGMKDTT